jgi:hypothetical protein
MSKPIKRDYLSASALKSFAKSPNHYIQYVTGKTEASPAMTFGSALHCYVLEPQEFEKRYAVSPKVDRRTKEGKILFAEFAEKADGKEVLTPEDFGQILNMDTSLSCYSPARELLDACTSFEQMTMKQINGVDFKGIADGMSDDFILDLKTCQDGSPEAFERTAHSMGYHIQAAAYRLLFNVDRFYWVAMEKNAPHNVSVYMQSEEAFHKAKHRLLTLIDEWSKWDGRPCSYSAEIMILNLPRWAK